MPNIYEYHNSINNEFINLRDRVRNLVENWQEDGRYKESIFKNILKRYLPSNYSIGNGFVVAQNENEEMIRTKQIDIIIYNNLFPLLFKEDDFIIATPNGICGIVEIKTRLCRGKLKDIIRTCNSNGKMIVNNGGSLSYNGLFFFDDGDPPDERIDRIISETKNEIVFEERNKYIMDHISIGENTLVKYWNSGYDDKYSKYSLNGLSYSFFIMNIISEIVWGGHSPQNRLWFVEDKELYLANDIH
jgi:hypothetical protein